DDRQPGIRRRRLRGRFAYFDAAGERIRDAEEIRRINALAIPPAYTDVWICPDPQGHLQAVGRDARGRKQYRYHPRWREVRDADKYERMLDFGRALPRLRRQVERHLALRDPAIPFHFRGKGGIEHRVSLSRPRLARAVRRCMELPGQQLFQYLDDDGQRREVSSADVNAYLQQHSGGEFSAKDYRTWAGSALALGLDRKSVV